MTILLSFILKLTHLYGFFENEKNKEESCYVMIFIFAKYRLNYLVMYGDYCMHQLSGHQDEEWPLRGRC